MYTLLIVDDEPAIVAGMCHILDWASYGIARIETALNLEEALARVIDARPDICLIDVCVGCGKGFELIDRMEELGLTSHFLMMSGYSEFEYAIESLRRGARDYLLKPVETDKLAATIERIIVKDLGGSIRRASDERNVDPVLQIPLGSLAPLVEKALTIARAEHAQKVSLRSVAERFRVNATYLGQVVLKETGMKFSEYIMRYRLLKARELIEGSDETIQCIAERVGYPNLNYFYAHFKEYYGVSPTAMRGMKGR